MKIKLLIFILIFISCAENLTDSEIQAEIDRQVDEKVEEAVNRALEEVLATTTTLAPTTTTTTTLAPTTTTTTTTTLAPTTTTTTTTTLAPTTTTTTTIPTTTTIDIFGRPWECDYEDNFTYGYWCITYSVAGITVYDDWDTVEINYGSGWIQIYSYAVVKDYDWYVVVAGYTNVCPSFRFVDYESGYTNGIKTIYTKGNSSGGTC